jgi:hypothetical protein
VVEIRAKMKKEVEKVDGSVRVATIDAVVKMEATIPGRTLAQTLSLSIAFLEHTTSRAVEGMRELALTLLTSWQLLIQLTPVPELRPRLAIQVW